MSENLNPETPLQEGNYWIKVYENSNWTIAYYKPSYEKFSFITHSNPLRLTHLHKSKVFIVEPTKILPPNSKKYKHGTISKTIALVLDNMSVGSKINIDNLIGSIWGKNDEFIRRSFDVQLCNIKKELNTKEFIVSQREILRKY